MTNTEQDDQEEIKKLEEIETTQEENNDEIEKIKNTIPKVPGKISKIPNFLNDRQFGKGNNFSNNSFNKQRQGRSAGRGR